MLTSVTGALLGTQANRQVAVVNSFEMALVVETAEPTFDQEFFERRKEQCELEAEHAFGRHS